MTVCASGIRLSTEGIALMSVAGPLWTTSRLTDTTTGPRAAWPGVVAAPGGGAKRSQSTPGVTTMHGGVRLGTSRRAARAVNEDTGSRTLAPEHELAAVERDCIGDAGLLEEPGAEKGDGEGAREMDHVGLVAPGDLGDRPHQTPRRRQHPSGRDPHDLVVEGAVELRGTGDLGRDNDHVRRGQSVDQRERVVLDAAEHRREVVGDLEESHAGATLTRRPAPAPCASRGRRRRMG